MELHSPMDRCRPHDCADSRSQYTIRCYWDPTDGISLCLDADAMGSVARTRNGFVGADLLRDTRVGVENVPRVAL